MQESLCLPMPFSSKKSSTDSLKLVNKNKLFNRKIEHLYSYYDKSLYLCVTLFLQFTKDIRFSVKDIQ